MRAQYSASALIGLFLTSFQSVLAAEEQPSPRHGGGPELRNFQLAHVKSRSLGHGGGDKKASRKKKSSKGKGSSDDGEETALSGEVIADASLTLANRCSEGSEVIYDTDEDSSNTKVSFTNEIEIELDCATGKFHAMNATLEETFVRYQNQLLSQTGCTGEDMEYQAAAVTDIMHCVRGGQGECQYFSPTVGPSACGYGGRRTQETERTTAFIRYRYNAMATCRRTCATQSLPKENDCVNCGKKLLRHKRRRVQEEGSVENRLLLVNLLNKNGIQAYGAVVIGDRKNDCTAGGESCCGEEGKCCGVTKGCTCPAVTESYCMATACDLPGCCGHSPEFRICMSNQVVCDCSQTVILGQGRKCDTFTSCQSYEVCDPTEVCTK